MNRTTVFMVRHGVTNANRQDRFAGHGTFGLHPDGEHQMVDVARRLTGHHIRTVVTGSLHRTMRSGTVLARVLGCRVAHDSGLDDIRIPHWNGKTKKEITERYGSQYPVWKQTPHLLRVAGCETLADVQTRAVQTINTLRHRFAGDNILVVSHLIVLRVLALFFMDQGLDQFRAITIKNGDIAALTFSEEVSRLQIPFP